MNAKIKPIRNTHHSTLITKILSTEVERIRQIVPICENEPNFPRFQPKNKDFTKKRTQNKPNLFSAFCLLNSVSCHYAIRITQYTIRKKFRAKYPYLQIKSRPKIAENKGDSGLFYIEKAKTQPFKEVKNVLEPI
jgi:hypothetical protein